MDFISSMRDVTIIILGSMMIILAWRILIKKEGREHDKERLDSQ